MFAAFLLLLGVCTSVSATQPNAIYFQVKEEQDPKAFVGDVSKTHFPNRLKIGGFKIRYAIQDSTHNIFSIDANTGIVRTEQVLDRENLPSSARGDVFQIQIVVSDKSGSLTVVSPTEIRILDINDNDPKFPKDFEALRISESAPLYSRFQLTAATDADIGNNSIQSYRIVSGNEDGMFQLLLLKPTGNVMYLYLMNVKRLDRETKAFYHLVLAAVDGGTPLPRSGQMELNITVLDSNDHSPQFSKFNYVGQVRENSPNGTYLLRVTATDKDIGTNGEIRYSLDPLPEYRGLFRIHPHSGKVWTNAPLDYEYEAKYVLSVSAQDLGPDSIPSKASITVEILDENDNAPVIIVTPVQSAIDKYGRIPEDIRVKRNVAIIDVHDDDSPTSDNSKIDLLIERHRNDFSLVKMFKTRYVLEVQRPLNLSRQARYKIMLIARDRGKPMREANHSVLLRIADKNRHAPNFTKPVYNLIIVDDTKPGTLISTIAARDPDTDREGSLKYSIKNLQMGNKNISNPSIFFTFGRTTGELRVIPQLWCTFTPLFRMVVEAKDNGRVRRTGTTVIKVIVKCAKYQYNFTVRENQSPGAVVGRVVINPPSPGKKLSFSIINSAGQHFAINNATGLIKTTQKLDRENAPSHALIVVVTDGDTEMSLTVLVNIEDENDNAPIFIGISDNQEVSVPSTSKRGDEVIIITATDPDQGRNGVVHFSLESGNGDKTFILDKDRGVLVVFDYLFESSYELKIKATDGGEESKSTYVTLKVIVTLPKYLQSTERPSDDPVYDSRSADGGLLKSKTMLVVVILCSIVSLLVFVVIVVVIIKCYKRQGETKTKKCTPLKHTDSSFGEPQELSREAAIKASKQMYSEATVNMYSSNEMLDNKKGKPLRVSQAQPLPMKSSFSSASPPTSTTSPSHRQNGPPPYADIYPPISTTRPVSEGFSSGDELDSGRGDDSSLPSSPYSCHTLTKSHNEPKHYSTYKHPKRDSASNCNHYNNKHPVVTLPNRSQHKKKTVTIADNLPHKPTDL